MKRIHALLFAVLVIMSSAAAPQASAAACGYNRQDLPVPAVDGHISTQGSSTDNSRIVGLASHQGHGRGLLWVNSTLKQLPAPTSDWDHVIPQAVNNTGAVAGYLRNDRDVQLRYQAVRYENGAYEFLQTEPRWQSKAIAVNNAGDVLGLVWQGTNEFSADEIVLWPRNGVRKTIARGTPVGINDQRKIVVEGRWATRVIDADTGATTELPGESTSVRFDNDRVLRREFGENWSSKITEWDLDGVQVARYEGGAVPFGKNRSGTVFSTYTAPSGAEVPSLWRKTGRTEVIADQGLFSTVYADVTDAATLIGTYPGADAKARPARWLWVCS